jgi:AcrR family transcriptional regulator
MGARERMIDAAERLFAERGINGVSLREIGAAAGQRNNSAAQYHFESKAGLVDAIFQARMAPIDEQRRALLDQVETAKRQGDLRALVEALVYPLASALAQTNGVSWYARFLAQVVFEPGFEMFAPERSHVTAGLERLIARFHRRLDHIPGPIRTQRIALASNLLVHALADYERTQHARRRGRANTLTLLAADLVDVIVALLDAPVSSETKTELRAAKRASA